MNNDDILNAQQAANLLGAHVETIRRMARKGALPAFKIGKDWRFRRSSLLAWAETNPGAKKNVCVLVIDDDASVCKLMRRILSPRGYRVITAPGGAEGLAIVKREVVNLILLDLAMPIMGGPEVIRELKKTHEEIPVIVVTGHPDSELMAEALHFGPLSLIPKPIDKSMLLSAVNLALKGALADDSRE